MSRAGFGTQKQEETKPSGPPKFSNSKKGADFKKDESSKPAESGAGFGFRSSNAPSAKPAPPKPKADDNAGGFARSGTNRKK
jgi:hypothetical protein